METIMLPGWVLEILVYTILGALGFNVVRTRVNSSSDTKTKGRRPSGDYPTLSVEVNRIAKDVEDLRSDVRAISSTLQSVEMKLALFGQRLDLKKGE